VAAHWTAAPVAVIEPEIVMQRGDVDIEVDDETMSMQLNQNLIMWSSN